MAELTKIEKINLGTTEIAKRVREQLKTEFPNCKFSVTTQQYSGGSSISINLMKADIQVVKDIDDISDAAIEQLGTAYTRQDIRAMQKLGYRQLNRHTLHGDYDSENWCNGVFLTEQGHNVLQKAVAIATHYNYDDSVPEADYYSVNFSLDIGLGKWDKAFEDGVGTVPDIEKIRALEGAIVDLVMAIQKGDTQLGDEIEAVGEATEHFPAWKIEVHVLAEGST